MTTTPEELRSFPRPGVVVASSRRASALEAFAVLVSPVVLYVVLRLRGMAPPQLPDPSQHTTFIIDPHDIFARYQALFEPSSRLREAARVGFLVPARLAYLLFGAVPGFFAFRYVLALVAIVPVYVLLKRLYGRWAGFVGIAVVMSCPIILTAWGTDFPDSAEVSYMTGGFAALALSWEAGRWRVGWLAACAGLFTMAVWSLASSAPLVIVTIGVYLAVRLARERGDVVRDLALLVLCAVVVTGLLALGSGLLIGPFDFITPTVKSAQYLSMPYWIHLDHSTSWSWGPYVPYLLVPPAIAAAYVVVFGRRWRDIGTTQLFVGVTAVLQLATFVYLQFFGNFQALEMHFFSSVLWGPVSIMLAMIVAEVTRAIAGGAAGRPQDDSTSHWRAGRWLLAAVPSLLVLAVAWAYEGADRAGLHVPALMWTPWGAALAAIVVIAAIIGRWTSGRTTPRRGATRMAGLASKLVAAGAAVAILGAALVLSAAPDTLHRALPSTVYDPAPAYSEALGGNDSAYVAQYTVNSELPGFVGPAAYPGEVLLTWTPIPHVDAEQRRVPVGDRSQYGILVSATGIFHNAFTWVSTTFPKLRRDGVRKIERWRAAQVLMMSGTGQDFARAVRSLARFEPVVVRRAVLSDGSDRLHVWLVNLERYLRPSHSATAGA